MAERGGGGAQRRRLRKGVASEEGVAVDAGRGGVETMPGRRRALPWTPRRGGELGSGDEAWTTRLCR
uniref:Uncharacterized protein n=1 Tax=Fagus sylvatica TaxID=28930 RepID=A0A2N9IDQ5_FAGSY